MSIPAFDDARGELVAAGVGGLVTMTTPPSNTPPATPAADPANAPQGEPSSDPVPPAPPTPAPGSGPGVTPAAAAPLTGATGPLPVRAAAGAVTITREPATYTLDGRGHSMIRDAARAAYLRDGEAQARLDRFNAEIVGGNSTSLGALVTAISAGTVGGVGGLATAAPIASPALTDNVNIPASFLPARNEALREAIDAGRPLVSRLLPKITLTDATPFRLPRSGRFEGVAPHVEGTAHVAAGTLTLTDAPAMPQAVSGYYELSRELADASNPAIDRIAMREMVRDYRRTSEEIAVAAIEAVPLTVGNVDTAMELRAALVNFVDDDGFGADFVAVSQGVLGELYADVDSTGRPMISSAGNAPTAVGGRAGYTGAGIDGIELVRVPRLAANTAWAIRTDDVLFGESTVQQFRFEEVKGPGLICLALWAYVVAAVLDEDGVLGISTGAIGG